MSKLEKDEKEENKILNIGYKGAGCFFLLLIILCISFFVYIAASKPKELWSPVVTFLNDEVELNNEDAIPFLEAKSIVENKINENSAEVVIPEEVISSLTQNSFHTLKQLDVQIEENKMLVYFEIEKSIPENPLYGLVSVKIKNKQDLEVDKVGVVKFGIPKQINRLIINSALSYFTLGEKLEDENLLYKLLSSKNSFKAESIEFRQDELVLKNVSFDLY